MRREVSLKKSVVLAVLFFCSMMLVLSFVQAETNPQIVAPSNFSNLSGTVQFNFTWDDVVDYDFYYSTGASWTIISCFPTNNQASPNNCSVNTASLSDGVFYEFNLTTQNDTNSSDISSYVIYNVTIDNTRPNVTLTSPANATNFSTSSITFNWTQIDAIDTNLNCTFFLDGVSNESDLINGTNKAFDDGSYSWNVACVDDSGNTNTTQNRTFIVDTTAPSFLEINITPNSTGYTNASPVISLLVNESNPRFCQYHNGSGTWINLTITDLGSTALCSGQVPTQTNGVKLNFTFNITDSFNFSSTQQADNLTVDSTTPTVNITSPNASLNITDGESFFVNATVSDTGSGIVNGTECVLSIGGFIASLTGSVLYNSTTGLCSGTVTLIDPSELDAQTLSNSFVVNVSDNASNTGSDSVSLLVDNLAPLVTFSSNVTVVNSTSSILFTILSFDSSYTNNVSIGNATNITAQNSTPLNTTQTTETFTSTTTASTLGCSSGTCVVYAYANDSWGQLNNSQTVTLVVDEDTPTYTNEAINDSGPVSLKTGVLISALWSDSSLTSSTNSYAQLQKFNGTSFSTTKILALNNSVLWSNFTYIPFAQDEGKNLTLRILYTDLAGKSNTTGNFSVVVQNSTPVITNISALNLTNNISTESPTFTIQYSDVGYGFSNDNITIYFSGSSSGNFTRNNSWVCSDLTSYSDTLGAGEYANFTTSSYDATNYSFRIVTITNANSSSATVTLERLLYADSNTTTISSWGSFATYEDIIVTLDSSSNVSGNEVTLSFTERMYTEQVCNITVSNLLEGAYVFNVSIIDNASNSASNATSWVVDSARPVFVNISANSELVRENATAVATQVTLSDSPVNISFSLNETNTNETRIFVDTLLLYTASGNVNSTLVSLAPGHHQVTLSARDVTYPIGDETNVIFEIYLNSDFNLSEYVDSLNSDLGLNANVSIIEDGIDITNETNTTLNGTIGLYVEFEQGNYSYNLSTEALWGLEYNWNNSFSLDVNATQSDALAFSSRTGISAQGLARVQNYSGSYERFLVDSQDQKTNWTINDTNLLVALLSNEEGDELYLLSECGANTQPESIEDSCYVEGSSNTTVYASLLSGIFFGNDAGNPDVTVSILQGTTVNDSTFTVNVSVIEPSPNSTTFCDYAVYRNNTAIDSQVLALSNFTLQQSVYELFVSYTQALDYSYSANVTCYDTSMNSGSDSLAFSVSDSTAPSATQINVSSITQSRATFSVLTNEYARFRINYSTSFDSQTSQSSFSEFSDSNNVSEFNLTDLSSDSLYFYRVQTCDINGECAYSDISFFRTLESSASSSSSGGGGGGGASLPEGAVKGSHYRGWDFLASGPFSYDFEEEDVAITHIGLRLNQSANNPYIKINGYQGKPNNVPSLGIPVYQYLHFEHSDLIGDEYEIEFRIPEEYEQIEFYRLEFGVWAKYNIIPKGNSKGENIFRVYLPGFSYFAIAGYKPNTQEESTQTDTQENPGNENGNSQTGTQTSSTNTNEGNENPDQENTNTSGTIAGYGAKESSSTWIWVLVFVLLIAGLVGGFWFVYTHKPQEQKSIVLNKNDPFYQVQEYINEALNRGHSPEEIRAKLLSVGWDDIVVDEEIEKITTSRISQNNYPRV